MPFQQAKDALAKPAQCDIDELLVQWATSSENGRKQAADNLRNESGSDVATITTYLGELAQRASQLQSNDPANAFHQAGLRFAFQGYDAAKFNYAVLGRAIRLKSFLSHIQANLEDDPRVIKGNLIRLQGLSESDVDDIWKPYFAAIRATPIGGIAKDPIFATFSEYSPWNAPWRQPLPTGRQIRDCLGLGHHLEAGPHEYILLMYKIESAVPLTVPTTASPGWRFQEWFRPNPMSSTQRYGRTKPLLSTGVGLPEVIHPPAVQVQIDFPFYITGHE